MDELCAVILSFLGADFPSPHLLQLLRLIELRFAATLFCCEAPEMFCGPQNSPQLYTGVQESI